MTIDPNGGSVFFLRVRVCELRNVRTHEDPHTACSVGAHKGAPQTHGRHMHWCALVRIGAHWCALVRIGAHWCSGVLVCWCAGLIRAKSCTRTTLHEWC